MPPLTVAEHARCLERGARSAIGTFGFELGGLLVDGGKRAGEELGQLVRRVSLPAEWRFVLARRRSGSLGLMGQHEKEAFAQLPPVPKSVTEQLWHITNSEMLPAIERSDCNAFGEAVYRFGRLAGECFAPVQGGAFASSATAELVAAIRDMGINGVGQSSWGPTVFAITSSQVEADQLVARLHREMSSVGDDITIARPNNVGAQIKTLS
jgi:beta-RFAP synthase